MVCLFFFVCLLTIFRWSHRVMIQVWLMHNRIERKTKTNTSTNEMLNQETIKPSTFTWVFCCFFFWTHHLNSQAAFVSLSLWFLSLIYLLCTWEKVNYKSFFDVSVSFCLFHWHIKNTLKLSLRKKKKPFESFLV